MRGCCWQPANEWDILLVGIFVFHRATRGSSVTSAVKTHVGFCLKWSLEAGWMLDLHSCQMSIFRSSAMFKNILADLNVSSSILQTNTHLEWSSNKGIWQCFDQSCIMWQTCLQVENCLTFTSTLLFTSVENPLWSIHNILLKRNACIFHKCSARETDFDGCAYSVAGNIKHHWGKRCVNPCVNLPDTAVSPVTFLPKQTAAVRLIKDWSGYSRGRVNNCVAKPLWRLQNWHIVLRLCRQSRHICLCGRRN